MARRSRRDVRLPAAVQGGRGFDDSFDFPNREAGAGFSSSLAELPRVSPLQVRSQGLLHRVLTQGSGAARTRLSQTFPRRTLADLRRLAAGGALHSAKRAFSPDLVRSRIRGLVIGARELRRIPAASRECARRSIRRELLFAFGLAGRKGSAPGSGKPGKRYRRSELSRESC